MIVQNVKEKIQADLKLLVEMTAVALQNRRGMPIPTPAGVVARVAYLDDCDRAHDPVSPARR